MDEAGAVEQDIDPPDPGERRFDRGIVQHVEPARDEPRRAAQFGKRRLVDVGGNHVRAGSRERQHRCTSDTLRGGGADHRLAFQTL